MLCWQFVFGDEHRAVPLDVHVRAYPDAPNDFLFAQRLQSRVIDVIHQFSDGKPTLVFCTSQKAAELCAHVVADQATRSMSPYASVAAATSAHDAVQLATSAARRSPSDAGASVSALLDAAIVRSATRLAVDPATRRRLLDASLEAQHPLLRIVLKHGVGIHHGGLSSADRSLVEALFAASHLPVVCTTTTLALGVNLPARLVIVNSTTMYRGAEGFVDIPRNTVLQMAGRAGRPDFDSRGVAVILTKQSRASHYLAMTRSADIVESHILPRLLDHINAEIAARSIASVAEALTWIERTFLSARARRDPRALQALEQAVAGQHQRPPSEPVSSADDDSTDDDGEVLPLATQASRRLLRQLAEEHILTLKRDGFIQTVAHDGPPKSALSAEDGRAAKRPRDDSDGQTLAHDEQLEPRSPSCSLARAYIRYESARKLLTIPFYATIEDILRTLVSCTEMSESLPLRRSDKRAINDTSAGKLPGARFSLSGRATDAQDKAFILLQVALSRVLLTDPRLALEADQVRQRAIRLCRALIDLLRGDDIRSPAVVNAIVALRSLERCTWNQPNADDSADPGIEVLQLTSLPSISTTSSSITAATAQAWIRSGIRRLEDVIGASVEQLQALSPASTIQVVRSTKQLLASVPRVRVAAVRRIEQGGAVRIDVRIEPLPSQSGATAPDERSASMAKFVLCVSRNVVDGLAAMRTVMVSSETATELSIRLPALGLSNTSTSAVGNERRVMVHLLHRHLIGRDSFAVIDLDSGAARCGPLHAVAESTKPLRPMRAKASQPAVAPEELLQRSRPPVRTLDDFRFGAVAPSQASSRSTLPDSLIDTLAESLEAEPAAIRPIPLQTPQGGHEVRSSSISSHSSQVPTARGTARGGGEPSPAEAHQASTIATGGCASSSSTGRALAAFANKAALFAQRHKLTTPSGETPRRLPLSASSLRIHEQVPAPQPAEALQQHAAVTTTYRAPASSVETPSRMPQLLSHAVARLPTPRSLSRFF